MPIMAWWSGSPRRRRALVLVMGGTLALLAVLAGGAGRERNRVAAPERSAIGLDRAVRIRALTGTHTRIVWVRDVGDGRDVFAQGARLQLMALDTDDGRGERAVLATPSNYAKPFITPRGDRIVFSNRIEGSVYVVNWDGTGLRRVTSGSALALSQDPDGTEWVYVGENPRVEDGGISYRPVSRVRIDRPQTSELVWDRSRVSEDGFRVSPDGRWAGGSFPEIALARLPNGELTRVGEGCWPGLAPDRPSLLWYFDGAHRNLLMIETATGERWQVNLSRAPGIEGYEVYHPRWSNDGRFLVMSGPYRIPAGPNRIRGGGPEVEIHLGRFDRARRTVEAWATVTADDRPDFYPDAWLSGWSGSTTTAAGESRRPPARAERAPGGSPLATQQKPARLVVDARFAGGPPVPAPAAIAPYRHALIVNRYEVVAVIEGRYPNKQLLVAQWGIRDRRVLPSAARVQGRVYRLVLEPYEAHPELEGQRLIMETDNFALPLYYDPGSSS